MMCVCVRTLIFNTRQQDGVECDWNFGAERDVYGFTIRYRRLCFKKEEMVFEMVLFISFKMNKSGI